ncbi:SDR family NAD(P)-dependent oxidoreductase [Mycobacterium sp. NAZ190054]|uniref:SDR family oxidoreductase n=1 Tax=Mycobacterium sp. NAZ190054 TaxID=1747766 RepID=UPI000793D6EF|nr:SDR family NAD(P)-dependent oxidoreductase [Mycobacterium sp. NAZ190054]KWX59890.1 hypothetical protein ASJ79_09330 [Mycobacterium sp. NAZ190054]
MTTPLHDRVYIVTGAASGIGKATAEQLHGEGRRVVLADMDRVGAEALAAQLDDARPGSARAVDHDVTSADSWAALVERVSGFGTIYGLVNNAGITRDKSMLSMTEDQFHAVIDVHLRGSWLGCKAVIPAMRAGGGGSIVNISSSNRHGAFGQTNYSAAKAGIVGLTKAVAAEQAKHGIRCNAVAPGAVDTPMIGDVPERVRAQWLESIALGRLGKPSEIAAAIAFLLSDAASYVTAALLDVNGGEQHL